MGETQSGSQSARRPAPEFPLGLDWLNTDRPLTWGELRGKVVIIDFWTYGCINCMHVIPDLKRLEADFPDELVVIGVHSAKFENERDTENIRHIVLRYGLKHPIVNDRDFLVWRAWDVHAWPTVFIIDPAGNVVGRHSGEGVYMLFKPIIGRLVRDFEARGLLDRTPLQLQMEKAASRGVLSFPGKVLADDKGRRLFVADTNHHRIIVADIASGKVLKVIGSGQPGFKNGDFRRSSLDHPQGMALEEDGRILYIADTGNHAVRRADVLAGEMTTLVGVGFQSSDYPPRGGTAPEVALNSPWDVWLDGGQLYIAMAGAHQIWVMDTKSMDVHPFAGSGREGTRDGALNVAELAQPSDLTGDSQGRLYFADSEGSSIRRVDTQGGKGEVTTLVGSGASLFDYGDVDGISSQARLQHPLGVVHYKGALYVADTYNHKIKRLDPRTREIRTTLGGQGGWRDGTDPLFYEPGGIDAASDKLYIADTNNHCIRVVDLAARQTSTLLLEGIGQLIA
ncbi:MAG: redoxin domain-containing protein [Chloroflexi bacterium]|nr:redoxin domain-containing protein [Chloroflexota bacterium]